MDVHIDRTNDEEDICPSCRFMANNINGRYCLILQRYIEYLTDYYCPDYEPHPVHPSSASPQK